MSGYLKVPIISVEIDRNEDTKKYVESIQKKETFIGGVSMHIEAARIEGDELHVIGYRGLDFVRYYEIIKNMKTGEERREKAGCFRRKRRWSIEQKGVELKEKNVKELNELIKDIRMYQGNIEEMEKELGALERVDTGKAETWIKKPNTLLLRYKAWKMNADAIVHYAVGSATGTPVKFKKKGGGIMT